MRGHIRPPGRKTLVSVFGRAQTRHPTQSAFFGSEIMSGQVSDRTSLSLGPWGTTSPVPPWKIRCRQSPMVFSLVFLILTEAALEFRLLEDFIALADKKSFSRAAFQRNSTQSALSRRIQSLEAWLGAAVIDRRANPLKLTPAGEAFYELAQESLRAMKYGREEIAAISAHTTSTVSFAVTHSLSLNFFPRWIHKVQNDMNALSLRLLSFDGERCREALMNGDCHFMIAHFEDRMAADFPKRLKSLTLAQDRLIPVAAAANFKALASLPGTPEAHTPYLRYTAGSFMGRSLDLFLQQSKIGSYLQPCFETTVAEGIKGMVLEGLGVGWLPQSIVRRELETGALARAGGPEWDVAFEIRLFRPVTRLPKSAENLWSLLAKQAPTIDDLF